MSRRGVLVFCMIALVAASACGKYGKPVRSSELPRAEGAESEAPEEDDSRDRAAPGKR